MEIVLLSVQQEEYFNENVLKFNAKIQSKKR